jgi:hypothetical protein
MHFGGLRIESVKMRRHCIVLFGILSALQVLIQGDPGIAAAAQTYDVVIYGGTSAGIAAGIQVRRMGGSVVVLSPESRIGGLTTGGLGQTDIGNKAAIGGLARDFYRRVRAYYADPAHWRWEKQEEYRDSGQSRSAAGEEAMWTFEPSAALAIMQGLVREFDVPVITQARLDRTPLVAGRPQVRGVIKEGARIVAIRLENGDVYRGRTFIDATYEGDLLAGAGVTYLVGREANSQYAETLDGVQTANSRHHQFFPHVDPFVEAGNRASGLLPGIDPAGPGTEGGADHRVQAYCFRMCLTDHPENRIPFTKPADYDPLLYELLLRNFEAGETGEPWINSSMPNRKTDTNNRTGFSTDFIGQNYAYPDADYAERKAIVQRHLSYQQGLMWTLANHPRVPEHIRKEVSRWGLCRDEFIEGNGWQEQLYIREARRMVGPYVMTEHNCRGKVIAEKPIGMAAYTMDSHNVQRYVAADGSVRNEGDVQIGGFPPYPIDYRAIVPRQEECDNLLVPVCLSATHIAFGSIRMEPVFMVLGQSAATAAMQALAADVPVQQLDYAALRQRLLADGQVLEHVDPGVQALKLLDGIVVDDQQATLTGPWIGAHSVRPYLGTGYHHDGNSHQGECTATFAAQLPPGRYDVRIAYVPNGNRATNIPIEIQHAGETAKVTLNGRQALKKGDIDRSLGEFPFDGRGTVIVSNAGTNGYVVIDAVRFVPVKK